MDAHRASERLLEALAELQEITIGVTADEAAQMLDDASLQVFWRDWPDVASWAGALWRHLNAEFAEPARPPADPDLDETGSSG